MNEKQKMIDDLKELHKVKRAWHIMVYGETLDDEILQSMSIDQLKEVYKSLNN